MIDERDIDRIATAMTAGEPSGALRARVLDRIQPRERATRWPASRSFFARVAAGAAVVVAAATFAVTRPDRSRLPEPALVTTSVPVATPASPVTEPPAPEPVTSRVSARPARVEMSAEELAWQSRRLPALPTPPPIELDAIQPEAISIAPISVEPIVMEPPGQKPRGF